jgi:hypothetical protein
MTMHVDAHTIAYNIQIPLCLCDIKSSVQDVCNLIFYKILTKENENG